MKKAIVICLVAIIALVPLNAFAMSVELLKDVPGKGKAGDIIDVNNNFARGFLFPKKLAREASPDVTKEMKSHDTIEKHHKEQEILELTRIAEKLSNKTIEINARTTADGNLNGTITAKELSDAIEKKFGIAIDKHKIECPEIKDTGAFTLRINLGSGINAKMNVLVQ